MARAKFPSAMLDQYMVRFPDGMRDALKAAASEKGRSLNAEIVARLEGSLDVEMYTRNLVAAQAEITRLETELQRARGDHSEVLTTLARIDEKVDILLIQSTQT